MEQIEFELQNENIINPGITVLSEQTLCWNEEPPKIFEMPSFSMGQSRLTNGQHVIQRTRDVTFGGHYELVLFVKFAS